MTDIQVSDDARVLYSGKCKVKAYGSSSNAEPHIGLEDLDVDQFDYIMHNLSAGTPVLVVMGAGNDIVWQMEMQFKSAYDSTAGKWIKLAFEYDQQMVDLARKMVDDVFHLDMIEGQVAKSAPKQKGEFGKYASELVQSQLMISPKFWEVVGPEERYLDWVRSQKCMITGKAEELDNGEKRCEAAHVRDIKYGAGIATKPEYFAIPLHPKVHAQQHEKGVFHMWRRAGRPTPAGIQYPIYEEDDHVRQWLKLSVLEYIRKWIQVEIKQYFNVESLSFISPEKLDQYLREKAPAEQIEYFKSLSEKRRDLSFLTGDNT